MKSTDDKSKLEISSHPPKWIRPLTVQEEEEIKEIYVFFVVHTPCKETSALSAPLTSYGWDNDMPPNKGYLQIRLCETAELVNGTSLFVGNKREDMKTVFNKAAMGDSFGDVYSSNRIAILINGNFLMDLFRNIRNSLAHCRFTLKESAGEMLFIMENAAVSGTSCEVKSRIVLKKSTLEDWMQIIKTEASIERSQRMEKRESLKKQVAAVLQSTEIKSIAQLAERLGMEELIIEKFVQENRDFVEYSRRDRMWKLCGTEGVAS